MWVNILSKGVDFDMEVNLDGELCYDLGNFLKVKINWVFRWVKYSIRKKNKIVVRFFVWVIGW